jgi:hypothetical protein
LRHADGRASRLIGLNTDVTGRRLVQEALLEVADGLAELIGTEAYNALVQKFAQVLGVREAFLCECVDHPPEPCAHAGALVRGRLCECEDFLLAGAPCERVIHEGRPLLCRAPWANAGRVSAGAVWNLSGPACFDTRSVVIGHIACRHWDAMRDPHRYLKLFAVRASVGWSAAGCAIGATWRQALPEGWQAAAAVGQRHQATRRTDPPRPRASRASARATNRPAYEGR